MLLTSSDFGQCMNRSMYIADQLNIPNEGSLYEVFGHIDYAARPPLQYMMFIIFYNGRVRNDRYIFRNSYVRLLVLTHDTVMQY